MLGRVEELPASNVSTATTASSVNFGQSDNGGLNQRPPSILRNSSTPTDEHPNWNGFGANLGLYGVSVKDEPMDDTRNDSGVTSGSDCPSVSPASDRSGTSHPTTSPGPNNMYPFNSVKSDSQYNSWYGSHLQNSPSACQGNLSPESHKPNSVGARSPKNDENSNDFDDDGIRNPKVNSHGRMKVHRCKQCAFYTYTKLEFWEHSRVHIKGDKMLKCPKCPFVTEYKHHLEYHLLNHAGAKPFKCPHCDYSCVNKSMLNSHLKSHSKVYQYRCADCNYETKYCHSLKLHLRKYGHKPDVVLHPDGTPNPYPVIDVYGTRRGPKVKKLDSSPSSSSALQPTALPVPQMEPQAQMSLINPLLNNQGPMLPFPLLPLPGFPGGVTPDVMLNFQNLFRERLEELAKQNSAVMRSEPVPEPSENSEVEALDLTNKSAGNSVNGESDNEDETMTTVFGNVEVVENQPEVKKDNENGVAVIKNEEFACHPCGISFGDEVMYRIHIGYHGYNNPFTCNMCGEECSNKVAFFLHIARVAH